MTTESPKTDTESMKLKKEEMMLYGLCPAQDEFFLVICEYCHLLIKPQALQYHMDVRHQDYSTSQFHNCALPNIDPIGPRNTKCSSHKTNSSVSAQSMNSTTGKSQTRPPRSKGRPSTKGANAAKNISEKTKPDVAVCESNVSVEKPRTGVVAAKKEPISLRVTPLTVKSENAVGNESVPPEVILPPLMATAVKVEPMEPVVFEPTHLKISEEKEALVKLLESNEWRDFEIKLKKEDPDGVDVKSDFLIPDASHPLKCQKARTCGEGSSHSNEVATAVTSAASTFTPTTSTCSLSKSSSVVTMLGIATNAGSASKGVALNARSSLSKASTETSCSVASSQPSTGRTLGDKTISLGKAIALVTDVDETPGNSLLAKPDKKSNLLPVIAAQVKTDASESSDHPTSAVTHSVSNVNSKVQLKGSKGRKSPSKFLLCKDREFDANKHCGVWVEDIQKQCTRSLTCKSHSLSLRRAVPGRSKLFDQLLSEQRARKLTIKDKSTKFKLKDKGTAPSATEPSAPIVTSCTSASTSSAGGVGSLSTSSGQDVVSGQPVDKPKKPVAIRHVKSLSVDMRENSLVGPSVSAREEKLPDGVKEEGSREDGSNVESYRHCTMSHHPHPAAVNGFNSWVYGRGCYVFNRKEDLYRAAFLAAVEKHLHPPPHKKLCLESNLQTDVGMAKDPYDFLLLDGGHVAQSYGSLSSPTASSKPKPKHMSSSAQPTSERRPSASSSSVASSSSSTNISTPKRPALDLLENKRKLAKTDVTSPDEALAKACALLPTDTIATVTTNATSVHLVLPTRVEPMASLSNGQMLGIPIAEMVAAQRKSNTELRIVRPHPPHLNKMPVRTATTQPLAPSKAVPLAAKVVPGYGIAPNASIKLELRPALDGAKLPTESGIASLISNSGQRNLAPSECVAVCARAPSCGSTVGNSLLKPTTSLMTTNRIPNIVLTSTIPNGTMKLAQRNATINSTNQTSLAAILALNHATNARFTPRSESQAFITSTISSLGRTNQAAVVPSLDTQRQLNLSAHMSTTLQLQSAITGPMAPTRSGFSVASAGSTIANRQYIFASGVPHVYQAPVSATPKKPLAASRVQLLRPDLAPAGKTAASTTPLLAGSKCHLSGQPI